MNKFLKKNGISVGMSVRNLFKGKYMGLRHPSRFVKQLIAIVVDISSCIMSVWLAFYLRLGEFPSAEWPHYYAIAVSIAIALPVFFSLGLYQNLLRFGGFQLVVETVRATAVYGLLFAAVITFFGIEGIPRTVGLIQPILFFIFVGSSRFFVRFFLTIYPVGRDNHVNAAQVLIYGAGSSGNQLASSLRDITHFNLVGFVDDNEELVSRVLSGKPIFSSKDLVEVIGNKKITHLFLAIPSATRRRRNEILKTLSTQKVKVQTLPNIKDVAMGRITVSNISDLDVDDLLGRDEVEPFDDLIRLKITSRVVMVTGAGGSIGSELCRQIIMLKPKILILVDFSEFALYAINSDLEDRNQAGNGDTENPVVIPILASVTDLKRMAIIIESWSPDSIFHAAAYKHVPLIEHNMLEGIRNNVFGTLNIAKLANENGVLDFILVSTDKAVRPTNVMGCSKRVAELCLQAIGAQNGSYTPKVFNTRFTMVRFGNVLNSSGSVIPKFRDQISNGGPVTVTHPDITRYFMTIPEAAYLVLQASSLASGGDVFVLDMGKRVKIFDLAHRMIELSGFSLRDADNPDGDIEIIITGMRPGEKLHEELFLGEGLQNTRHPKINRAQDPYIPWQQLESELATLKMFLDDNAVEEVELVLRRLVPEYVPNHRPRDFIFSEN